MSVDLEDHFCDLPFSTWENYESRVDFTTDILLELFEKYHVTATFFTLGYVAEKHPELIEKIQSQGHEIASHSYSHTSVKTMQKSDFENDLKRSIDILSKITGEKVLGFRAPWFSITKENLWVFDILKKFLKYDSSIYPVGPHYGFADAPRHFYKISDNPLHKNPDGNFFELPMATLRFPILGNIPIAGGIYLRFLPISLVTSGIKKLNKSGFPTMCYIHPQDLDPNRPKLKGTAWHNYWGLESARKKIKHLLENFKFSSARNELNL